MKILWCCSWEFSRDLRSLWEGQRKETLRGVSRDPKLEDWSDEIYFERLRIRTCGFEKKVQLKSARVDVSQDTVTASTLLFYDNMTTFVLRTARVPAFCCHSCLLCLSRMLKEYHEHQWNY